MKIEHIAIWCQDLERMKDFYTGFFQMTASEKYINPKKKFSSYFLSFPNAKTRIELMHRVDISTIFAERREMIGLAHFSISVGSAQKVDEMTELFRARQVQIVGEPRTTGDGYYESVIHDIEGNLVEITE